VVVAASDIPLSTRITAEELTIKTIDLTAILPGAYTDPSQVVGQIARQAVVAGAQVTTTTTGGGGTANLECPVTLRCMAVQVDQVSGVGTVIQTGDYVDMVVGLTADKFPVITVSPTDNSITVVAGLNSTSVKLLLQGLQVVGTLLPPAAPPPEGSTTASPAPSGGTSVALNGQQEIVILAVSAQQAEVLKFVQMDGNITLALRSPNDFIDPTTGAPLPPVAAQTTGIILKTLVDSYGVLPPEVVQTVTPTATKKP
ncbi:MAG: Flp pilus assembly protein CpaB, partial [Candidatus Limnocylindrales bacterium]